MRNRIIDRRMKEWRTCWSCGYYDRQERKCTKNMHEKGYRGKGLGCTEYRKRVKEDSEL